MKKNNVSISLFIGIALFFLFACKPLPPGPDSASSQPAAEALTLEALLKMFETQPDHMADRLISFNGSTVKINFAKKGDKSRQEFYPLALAPALKSEADRNYCLLTIIQDKQPAISIDPQAKTYAELPKDFSLAPFDIEHFLEEAKSELGKLKIEDTGTERVEGHEARKIRVTFEGEPGEILFYFAKDLNNLFIKMDSKGLEEMTGTYALSNISFTVPDELFTLPQGYKKVDFNALITAMRSKMAP
jgi:hypothetical protein